MVLKTRKRYDKKKDRAVRVYKKRKPKFVERSSIPRLLTGGFPQNTVVKLRYSEEFILNPGVPGVDNYFFRANSLYDPDYTAILGHQPLYYNQWSPMYKRYTVLGSKITMMYVPSLSSSVVPLTYGVSLQKESINPYFDPNTYIEATLSKVGGVAGGYPQSMAPTGKMPRVVQKYSAKAYHGVKDVKDNKELSGLMGDLGTGSDPTTLAYFNCWAISNNGNTPGPLAFRVIIDYIANLHDPLIVTQS